MKPTNGWLDMESAPKDGTRIIILEPDDDLVFYIVSWGKKGWGMYEAGLTGFNPECWRPLPTHPGA